MNKDVEEEKLTAVLEAGRLAPSASNRQEWRFGGDDEKRTPVGVARLYGAESGVVHVS